MDDRRREHLPRRGRAVRDGAVEPGHVAEPQRRRRVHLRRLVAHRLLADAHQRPGMRRGGRRADAAVHRPAAREPERRDDRVHERRRGRAGRLLLGEEQPAGHDHVGVHRDSAQRDGPVHLSGDDAGGLPDQAARQPERPVRAEHRADRERPRGERLGDERPLLRRGRQRRPAAGVHRPLRHHVRPAVHRVTDRAALRRHAVRRLPDVRHHRQRGRPGQARHLLRQRRERAAELADRRPGLELRRHEGRRTGQLEQAPRPDPGVRREPSPRRSSSTATSTRPSSSRTSRATSTASTSART